ncbi:SDR family NAD(P)-dependent oxidoreductase [Micromonospora ureilytica]|uniref:SDR family NAD(P)-dependent oxidoreductase n=1 Tax=Micromonospora ureilytica TaxID=709868 RepID=UPI004039663C
MDEVSRTALVTGASSGIGFEVARALAARGWHVLLHARTETEGRDATRRLLDTVAASAPVTPMIADFAQLSQVRALADAVVAQASGLQLLINNAAVIGPARRAETVDGNELSWQVNYLAPYLLTRSLLPVMRGARVVNVSSCLHRLGDLPWSDLNRIERYAPVIAYAQAKLALTMFGVALADRSWTEVTVASVHPGVVATQLLSIYGRSGVPVIDGMQAVLRAATGEVPVNGAYYEGCLPAAPAPLVADATAVERLWQLSERAVGASAGQRAAEVR